MRQHLHPARPDDLPEAADHIIEEFVERNAIPGASIAISTARRPDLHRRLRLPRPRHQGPGDTGHVLSLVLPHEGRHRHRRADARRRGPSSTSMTRRRTTSPVCVDIARTHGAPAAQPHRRLLEPAPDPLGPRRRRPRPVHRRPPRAPPRQARPARRIRSEEPPTTPTSATSSSARSSRPPPASRSPATSGGPSCGRSAWTAPTSSTPSPDLAATGYVKAPRVGRPDPPRRPARRDRRSTRRGPAGPEPLHRARPELRRPHRTGVRRRPVRGHAPQRRRARRRPHPPARDRDRHAPHQRPRAEARRRHTAGSPAPSTDRTTPATSSTSAPAAASTTPCGSTPTLGIGIVLMTNTTKAYDHHQLFNQLHRHGMDPVDQAGTDQTS